MKINFGSLFEKLKAKLKKPSKTKDKELKNDKKKDSSLKEWAKAFIYALIFAITIRTFLYEPFHIPSGSMKPGLLIGDYIFVEKFSYGYSKYSLPLSLPLIKERVFADKLERGDVAVFRKPGDSKDDFIKRVIGLPGDKIQMKAGRLYINGKIIPKKFISDYYMITLPKQKRTEKQTVLQTSKGDLIVKNNKTVLLNGVELPKNLFDISYVNDINCSVSNCVWEMKKYEETLPNNVSYEILEISDIMLLDDTIEYSVPENNYFMMGDNRDMSEDSRVLEEVGYVPYKNFIGKAKTVFFSVNGAASNFPFPIEFYRWHKIIRFERLFNSIK